MSTHDDFRTDEELKELGLERKDNRVIRTHMFYKGKWRPGHYVTETNTASQKVMRWVWDDEGRENTESGV